MLVDAKRRKCKRTSNHDLQSSKYKDQSTKYEVRGFSHESKIFYQVRRRCDRQLWLDERGAVVSPARSARSRPGTFNRRTAQDSDCNFSARRGRRLEHGRAVWRASLL